MLAQRTHALLQRPLGPSPTQGDLTPTGSRGRRGGEIELNSTSKRALETWFPSRQPLVTERGGSGRQTSARILKLQLRIPDELPASPARPSPVPFSSMVTPGPGWRTIARGHAPASAAEEVAEILQQAREARWAGLPRHTGSGRVLTARRLQLTYNPVPLPLTPFVPTPVAPVQASPLPKTPAAALIQSLLRSSASLGSPMEGVPERAGPVLQPKTPAFAYTPMEGVPERMSPNYFSTGRRRLQGGRTADEDSPIGGILRQPEQVPVGAAQPSASQSNSFAFSRAGFAATPGVQSCSEDDQAARMHPLGFFDAEGARQLCHVEDVRMLDGAPKTPWRLRDYDPSPQLQPAPKRARRAGAAAPQPPLAQAPEALRWPALAEQAPEHSRASGSSQGLDAAAVAAQALQDRPAAAEEALAVGAGMQQEQNSIAGEGGVAGGGYNMDDNEDNDFGGYDGGWGDGDDDDGPDNDHDDHSNGDGAEHDSNAGASMPAAYEENRHPNSSSGPNESQVHATSAAKPRRPRRRPTSSNKRLRKEFQSRKSLAGDGLQAEGPLRRSTRLSVKPLDWWRNEKVIYERKYKSLPTVVERETMPATPTWTFVSDYRKKQGRR